MVDKTAHPHHTDKTAVEAQPPAMRLRDHASAQVQLHPDEFKNLVDAVADELERRHKAGNAESAKPAKHSSRKR